MKVINGLWKAVLDEELEIKVYRDKVYVANYDNIGHFDNKLVTLFEGNKQIMISGNKLIVSKLLNNEVLIEGEISKIELR